MPSIQREINPTTADCACNGRGWLIVSIDGDELLPWVQRCDDCQYFNEDDPRNLYDEDVAPIAAAQTNTTVGYAYPMAGDHECDHTHPYLIGYTGGVR